VANHKDFEEGLLVKYLTNDLPLQEAREVEDWIQASEENKRHFDQVMLIWEQSLNTFPKKTIEADDAWMRMKQRMSRDREMSGFRRFANVHFIWRAAAIFILCFCAGISGYLMLQSDRNTTVTTLQLASAGKVLTDTLPDQSVITINKNSFLSYPSEFKGATREVTLNGEAFFKIKADKKHPFIVHANDVTVRVVGTSFNIKTVNGKTEVVVESGVVIIQKKGRSETLVAKEKTETNWHDTTLLKSTITDHLYNYYRSKEFVCESTPLDELIQKLNEAYNAEIELGRDALRDVRITTVFRNEPLDNIIDVICQTFKIRADKKGNRIILY
jgi:transmembrane sensor